MLVSCVGAASIASSTSRCSSGVKRPESSSTMRGSVSSVSRQSTSSPIRSFWRWCDRGVADAHPAVVPEAGEVRQELLVQVALAVDPVERLERPALGHVAQEVEELLALVEVPEAAQRLDDERRVAQPAIAVVPGARGAHRLGDARRGRGDDRAGVVVRVKLQAERRAQHLRRGEVRQRARLGPRAPPGDGELELVIDARERRRRVAAPVRQDEVHAAWSARTRAARARTGTGCSSPGAAARRRRGPRCRASSRASRRAPGA